MVKYSLNSLNQRIVIFLTIILNKIIESAKVPKDFNTAIIKPIIKDNSKSTNTSTNLRPVAVSDTNPNIFEKVCDVEVKIQCNTNTKQFGFKVKSSCSHAIFVIKQTIKFAKSINKRLYICAIDASKAFDKVIRLVLWWKMAMKGICIKLLQAMMAYYDTSCMKVEINGVFSRTFKTTQGNKQGGPLSSDFFNIYADELTELIEQLDCGIMLDCIKVDIVQYADDITLMASTAKDLQKQISTCEQYGKKYGIKFNPEKTLVMVLNLDVTRSIDEIKSDTWQGPLVLDGKTIQLLKSMKILGQIISDDDLDQEHIKNRLRSTNIMVAKLQTINLTSLHIHPKMKAQLFKTYIRPVMTYGTENMALNPKEILEFKKIEGNCLKRLIRIPTRCHTTDLFTGLNVEQTNNYLIRMKLKFLIRLDQNEFTNKVMRSLTELNLEESFSTQIANQLELKDYDYETLISSAKQKISDLEKSKKGSNTNENENVISIKKILKSKNRFDYPEKLFQVLKFQIKSFAPLPFLRAKSNKNFNKTSEMLLLLFSCSVIMFRILTVFEVFTPNIN